MLNIKRQAGGNAVGIELVGCQPLGFQKNLVAVFVGKAVDFVFYAGAIARPYPFNLAGEHGAAVKAAANNVVCLGIGMRNPARQLLRVHTPMAHKAEVRHGGIAGVGWILQAG